VYGYLPVMPMVLISGLLMVVVSLMTRPPSQATLDKYFPPRGGAARPEPAEAPGG